MINKVIKIKEIQFTLEFLKVWTRLNDTRPTVFLKSKFSKRIMLKISLRKVRKYIGEITKQET